MVTVQREVDHYLTLLRNKIREQGFTQLQVQEALGWGRSYISQLLTRQKALRIEQVLLILRVIGVEPRDFFAELYGHAALRHLPAPAPADEVVGRLGNEVEALRSLVHGLTDLLLAERVIDVADLSAAVKTAVSDADADGE